MMTRDEEFDFLMGQIKQQIDLIPMAQSEPHLEKWIESTNTMLRICERRVKDYERLIIALPKDKIDLHEMLQRDMRESELIIDEYYKVLNELMRRLAELRNESAGGSE